MKQFLYLVLFVSFIIPIKFSGQAGIPIYHDYLTDNLYLLHPSMAGASNCAKIRLTQRMQWLDVSDTPSLQTFSFQTHLGQEGNNGIGAIIFNDRNGYHSQKGLQLAFAHHLNFGNGAYVNKLSFGLAGTLVQNQFDATSFDPTRFDPVVAGIVQSDMYYNLDFGFSYHLKGFFFNATLKNALLTSQNSSGTFQNNNLRNFVVSTGLYTGSSKFHIEPSFLIQYKDYSGDVISDINMKMYWTMSNDNLFYIGASYRKDWQQDFEQNTYQTLSPLVGLNLGKLSLAYIFTYDMTPTPVSTVGFHQISLGYNFNCRRQLVKMSCPEIF